MRGIAIQVVRSGLALLILGSGFLAAQVFKVQGGVSTLLNAEGGSVDFTAPNYTGSVGVGFFEGRFQLGATAHYKWHDYKFTAGDDFVPFQMPTDTFDPTHYFSARGFSISRSNKKERVYLLGGLTTEALGTGFFRAARSERVASALFYERNLNDTLRLVSRNIISSRQTSIQSLEWQPKDNIKAAFSAGLGSNQRYFASTFEAQSKTMLFRAGYVAAGDKFRRVLITSPLTSEVEKENFDFAYQPGKFASFTAGHHRVVEPQELNSAATHATVNEVVGNFHVGRTYFGTGLFQSFLGKRSTVGTNLYGGRRFGQWLDVGANLFRTTSNYGPSSTMLTATVRESVSPRLSFLQLISRTAGQTSIAIGGDFITNRMTFRADYQNVYLPFRPDKPFQQALAVNAMVRLFGPLMLNVGSNVAPDGRIRYTIGATTYLYRTQGMFAMPQGQDSFKFPKYLVQGIVRDETGQPMSGIALHVGKEIAYTDDQGRFLVRFRKKEAVPMVVAVEEFMIPGRYEVVKAPASVQPQAEDGAIDIEIVLKRVKPAPVHPGSSPPANLQPNS